MRAQAAQTWAERAQAELGASQRFRALHLKLKSLDTHPQILRLVHQAEEDEDRHALLCAQMAIKLGHSTGFAQITEEVESKPYSWMSRPCDYERALLDVVLMCCITESMNASLLNTIYEHARQSEAGQLIHRILKDEVKHAQIGWAYLSQESQRRDCNFVAEYLIEMFDVAVKDEIFLPLIDEVDESLYELGVMPNSSRFQQFQDTLTHVVCPGFEQFGIDTQPINTWLRKRLSSCAL